MLIVVKGLLDNVVADVLWARAVLLTSPVVATVALSMTIPMAIASDVLLDKATIGVSGIAGALAIVAGFCTVALADPRPPDE